jgi:hypothetical protein|tara:strand:+ start:2959 stop:3540 length:582 start_codon:yes stop_codon:yes gene_type:complete
MSIKVEQIPFFSISFWRLSLSNWEQKKEIIKELVDLKPDQDRIDICYSDFFQYNNKPPYMYKFIEVIQDELVEFFNSAGVLVEQPSEWQMWTQMYTGADHHPLHNHGFGNFSCILYLDYDKEKHPSTRFWTPMPDPFFGTVTHLHPEVEEGDIIIFPSTIYHECPPTNSNIPRTIVAFNVPIADQSVQQNVST